MPREEEGNTTYLGQSPVPVWTARIKDKHSAKMNQIKWLMLARLKLSIYLVIFVFGGCAGQDTPHCNFEELLPN